MFTVSVIGMANADDEDAADDNANVPSTMTPKASSVQPP